MVGYSNSVQKITHVFFRVGNESGRSLIRHDSIAVQIQLDDHGSYLNQPYTNLSSALLRSGEHELISVMQPVTENPWRLGIGVKRHHDAIMQLVANLVEILNGIPLVDRFDDRLNGRSDVQSEWISPSPAL